jgi:hypothetical protein
VIEHIELVDVSAMIARMIIFAIKNPGSTIIITTPNAGFNKHYSLTTMRHDDHKWEHSVEQFREYFEDLVKTILPHLTKHFTYEFVGIGDSVNDEHVTQGVIVKTK